jgi:hypothetical protein
MITFRNLVILSVASIILLNSNVFAQEPPKAPRETPPPDTKKAPAAGAVIPEQTPRPVLPRETLEKEFQDALTGATLEGVWQMTGEGGLKGTAGLTDPKPDKYTITSATKAGGDNWIILARIEYGDKDVSVPVPVRVVWAEDTAIITLNDLAVPMIGTYSARVMIHNGFYSGVWYCNAKNYGGVMQGRIVKTPPEASKPAESK